MWVSHSLTHSADTQEHVWGFCPCVLEKDPLKGLQFHWFIGPPFIFTLDSSERARASSKTLCEVTTTTKKLQGWIFFSPDFFLSVTSWTNNYCHLNMKHLKCVRPTRVCGRAPDSSPVLGFKTKWCWNVREHKPIWIVWGGRFVSTIDGHQFATWCMMLIINPSRKEKYRNQ